MHSKSTFLCRICNFTKLSCSKCVVNSQTFLTVWLRTQVTIGAVLSFLCNDTFQTMAAAAAAAAAVVVVVVESRNPAKSRIP